MFSFRAVETSSITVNRSSRFKEGNRICQRGGRDSRDISSSVICFYHATSQNQEAVSFTLGHNSSYKTVSRKGTLPTRLSIHTHLKGKIICSRSGLFNSLDSYKSIQFVSLTPCGARETNSIHTHTLTYTITRLWRREMFLA